MKQMQTMSLVAALAILTTTFVACDAQAAVEDGPAKTRSTNVAMIDGVLTVDQDAPQADDHLFDGTEKFAAKAKESSEVNLDKSMLGLAARKGGDKGELAQKLDYVIVRNYEYANEGDYNLADVQAIMKKLDGSGWKHLVRTREGKEMTDICVKQDSEGVTKEMVIISAEPKELSFVHLKGNVNMSDMKNFGGVMKGAMQGDAHKEDPKLQKH